MEVDQILQHNFALDILSKSVFKIALSGDCLQSLVMIS